MQCQAMAGGSRGSGEAGGYVRFGRRSIGPWWGLWFDKPQTEMLEYLFDDGWDLFYDNDLIAFDL